MSGTRLRIQKEDSRPRSQLAPKQMATQFEGTAPPFLHARYPPGTLPAPHATLYPPVQGPYDMLPSPLGQHILDYEPPHGFVIPPFAMYEGSSDSYDRMLHFNQAMILNAGDDRLLCKVFSTSLKGPTLAWFHNLPRGSINSFDELWAVFVSQYLCSVRQKGNISPTDSQYQSKKQRRKMLRAASVRARVNIVRAQENITAVQPINGPISFPPINLTQVITPYYDALVLTVAINNFDAHRVLVDPGSAADLLHLQTYKQMRVSLDHLSFAERVLSGFNGATALTVGDITLLVQVGPVI